MSSNTTQKKGFFSAIKSRFPKKKRKSRYKVGYADLISDSCSLPSITEESQFFLDPAFASALQGDTLEDYNDCGDGSEGDSAYFTSSQEDGEIPLEIHNGREAENGRNKSPGDNSVSESLSSEGEVCSIVCSEEAETELHRRDESPEKCYTDSEIGDNSSSELTDDVFQEFQMPAIQLLCSSFKKENHDSGDCDVKLTQSFTIPVENSISKETEPMAFIRKSIDNLIEEDMTLPPGGLVSALSSGGECEPLYYENIRIKTVSQGRDTSKTIQEQIHSNNSNIFEKARLSSPIDSRYESEANDEKLTENESILLVDELDAYKLNRGVSPPAVVYKDNYIDTSVCVFPGGAQSECQLFKTDLLFSKHSEVGHGENENCFSYGDQEFEAASSSTAGNREFNDDYEEKFVETNDGTDQLPLNESFSDVWSLYTDTSTLKSCNSDTSSMTSMETVVARKSSSDEFSESYDGSDEDDGSEASERTSLHRRISWADEEFIELSAPLKMLWNHDTEFFEVIKFLSKWGKYNVIVEGTLDIDDFWEDHIYFQSNKGKFIDKGEQHHTHRSPIPHGMEVRQDKVCLVENEIKAGLEEVGPIEHVICSDEDDQILGAADCQIVDKLFTLYQKRKFLQFNALQQKSLYCGPCQSLHIIEII